LSLNISVIVPTYRRVRDLLYCLEGLDKQLLKPYELLVIVRGSDLQTKAALQSRVDEGRLRIVEVNQPGVVHALNMGIQHAVGDIIAITDDDAVPREDWLLRIEAIFREHPEVGGVGGRDWVHHGDRIVTGSKKTVGRLTWYGRVIGNHHLGAGDAREVDVLKGANMSFRRAALRGIAFEQLLRGTGAQVHNDLDISLSVRRAGWKLIYNPDVAVDHYPSLRHDEDQRGVFHPKALVNAVHNETLALLKHMKGIQRPVFLAWSILIGTSSAPGIIQFMRFWPRERQVAWKKLLASFRGRYEGWLTWKHKSDTAITDMPISLR
jgi:GT2 family glycosyltransferase